MNVFYMTCDTLINYLNLNFELELDITDSNSKINVSLI